MKSATRVLISTIGGLVGVMGIEHGIGEVLQGNAPVESLLILSWPDSAFFKILNGEPAMSILPNMLVTGLLAILVSLFYLAWSVVLVERKHGGLVLMLASIPMLLFGGGLFPPVFGVLVGAAATRIHAPLTWLRSHLPAGARNFLGDAWPALFGATVLSWLAMVPGVPALYYFFGVDSPDLIFFLLYCMFGFLLLAFIAGFARDLGTASPS